MLFLKMNTICETSVTSDTAVGEDIDSRSESTLDINDRTPSTDISLNVKHDVNKTDEKNLPHTVPSDPGGWVTSADEDEGEAGGAGTWSNNANAAIATASVLLAVVIVAVVVAVAAARGPLCKNSHDDVTGLCNSSGHT